MREIMERRSIRKYNADEVRKEDIEAIILAGTKAPSAKNRQPWQYIVYTASAASIPFHRNTLEKLFPCKYMMDIYMCIIAQNL